MTTQLAFHEIKFNPIVHNNQVFLTSKELAAALKYATTKSVTDIYNNNSDEFTQGMSLVVESTTNGINGSQRRIKVRVFSLRGAHLIAMFARTEVAKEFRKWVLDILDHEVSKTIPDITPIVSKPQTHTITLSDEEFCSLCYLWSTADKMRTDARKLYPILVDLGSKYAGRFYDIGYEFNYTLNNAQKALARESMHIEHQQRISQNWQRILPHLRDVKH
ncbi:P22AR C-terminal domain-containing protein [Hafnia paralvei]|uniref:P22AR C-terminal domain-containing protein n=2 Tax=Hafnia paralvei TaxID=546367 RepID=UPI002FDC2DDA